MFTSAPSVSQHSTKYRSAPLKLAVDKQPFDHPVCCSLSLSSVAVVVSQQTVEGREGRATGTWGREPSLENTTAHLALYHNVTTDNDDYEGAPREKKWHDTISSSSRWWSMLAAKTRRFARIQVYAPAT